jgi:hypothetical protein
VGYLYCCIRGYSGEMFTMFIWVFVYRMVDGLADVYEGRLQQMDKLYLAGVSQTIRSVLAFLVCTVVLFLTRDLGLASIAMGVAAIATFVVVTFPLALLETPKSRRMSFGGVAQLFKDGFPVFLALFLYQFIDNMPKFVMEGVLSYDNQLYFNALYFPAQSILMIVGFIYKPMLVNIANAWADPSRRKRFDLFVVAMIALIAGITVIAILLMGWIGIPIMSFLYGLDFERFRTMSYVMLVAGGITGVIDFLYQVVTVMRHQRDVMKLYVVTFGFSLFVPYLMVHTAGLNGAIDGYLIVMAFLAALLLMEYITVRLNYSKHPERDPNYLAGSPIEAKETHVPHRGAQARTVHRRTDGGKPATQDGARTAGCPSVRDEARAVERPAVNGAGGTAPEHASEASVRTAPQSGAPTPQPAVQRQGRVVYFQDDDAPQTSQAAGAEVAARPSGSPAPPERAGGAAGTQLHAGATGAGASRVDYTQAQQPVAYPQPTPSQSVTTPPQAPRQSDVPGALPANHVRRDLHLPSMDTGGTDREPGTVPEADDPWSADEYDVDADSLSGRRGSADSGR